MVSLGSVSICESWMFMTFVAQIALVDKNIGAFCTCRDTFRENLSHVFILLYVFLRTEGKKQGPLYLLECLI